MTRTVYVNGEFLAEDQAKVSVFDRGLLMADAVYEYTAVVGGKLLDFSGHMRRLHRSLGGLEIPVPCSDEAFLEIHRELVTRNNLDQGGVYLQITRGTADRSFVFPDNPEPTVIAFTQTLPLLDAPLARTGLKVISVPDLRWRRRDIKTVQLLYSSMCKTAAVKAGVDDAWFVEDGYVTEATAHNTFIVKDGVIVTRELSSDLLHGITRAAILRFCQENDMQIAERRFSIEEAKAASEAFLTAAPFFATAVIEIDGVKIGNGKPGPVTSRIREIYIEENLKTAI